MGAIITLWAVCGKRLDGVETVSLTENAECGNITAALNIGVSIL